MRSTSASEAKPEIRREPLEDARRARAPAATEDVEQFKRWMDARANPEHTASSPIADGTVRLDERERGAGTFDAMPAETAALLATQRFVLEAPMAPSTMQAPSTALVDLIEKHVRQMFVSEGARADGGRDAKIMLRLSDTLLPGTDLMLTREANGWSLRAEVTSAAHREALERCAPALVERFESGGLGDLQFDTVLRG